MGPTITGSKNNLLENNFFIKKIARQQKQIILLTYLKALLVQVLLFSTILYSAFYIYHKVNIKITLAEELKHIQSSRLILTKNLVAIADDLFLLRNDSLLNSYINADDKDAAVSLTELRNHFLFFSAARPLYSQVRYINENGIEILRINNQKQVVERSKLQDKSNRYYFKAAKKIKSYELFFSPLDLNMEHGKIEKPYKPVVRFGVPVFSESGKNKGMILLNYDATAMLKKFREHFISSPDRQYSLIRYDGLPVVAYDEKTEWDPGFNFSTTHPEIWEKMKGINKTQIYSKKGIYSIFRFKPMKKMKEYLLKVHPDTKVVNVSGHGEGKKMAAVSFIPQRALNFHFFNYISPIGWFMIIVIQLLTASLLWVYVKKLIKKRQFGHWMASFFQGIEQNPASIVLTDKDGNIQYTNKKFLELSGYSAEEVYMKNPKVLKSGEMPDIGYKNLWDLISTGENWRGEFHNKAKNGSLYWVFASISPIMDDKGRIMQYLGIQDDISERKRLQEALELQAKTDHLTKLCNRLSFFDRLESEIARSKRSGSTFSLMMLDIDHFKKINDSYGHLAGDYVIKNFAQILTKNSRTEDLSARYGGEEFVMLLPETTLDKVGVIVERIRSQVEESHILFEQHTINYTVSGGIAQWQPGEIPEEIIARADTNLYTAKQNGRNRVIAK